MKEKRSRRVIIWSVATLFLLACALPFVGTATQAPQPLSPALLGTPIAQTANAAKTLTVTYLPPSLTPTLTPFPTGTHIVLTSSPTFIYALPTFTPLPTWTSTPGTIIQLPGSGGSSGGSGGDGNSPFTGKEWTCAVTEKSPRKGTVLEPGKNFYAHFTIMNTGTKTWPYYGVDFINTGGYLHEEGGRIMDLPKTVAPGGKVTIDVLYVAPKGPGTYNSIWTLKVGRHPFCGVKITFEVK